MDKPNILFILADDLGWGDVSYHNSEIRTPNIDRLVQSGIELDQHYVCPMCTPTRAALMTGRHPGRFGRHATSPSNPPVLPEGYETIATSFRNCGYDTGLFGKWHLGSKPEFGPNHYGFNTSYGSLAGGVDPYNHRYKQGEYSCTWHHNGQLIKERGHVTDLIADQAVKWIESRKQPWFCYVPFTAVHVPIKAPQTWIDIYEDKVYDSDPNRDRSFKIYSAYTSQMDHAIGRFVESLERMCVRENTIIVFSSDNGAIPNAPLHSSDKYPGRQEEMPRLGSNTPLRGQKAQLYEGGIRTPSLINWVGTLPPRKVTEPIHISDWMPTFTNLIGYTPLQDPIWDGMDIWKILTGEVGQLPERPIYWNFRGRDYALRLGNLKLISDSRNEGIELYDLGNDPYESKNLAPNQLGIARDLSAIILEEQKKDNVSKRFDAN